MSGVKIGVWQATRTATMRHKLITKEGYTGSGSDYTMMQMVEAAIKRLRERGVIVQLLSVT
ncbi:hypothetical protein COCNU_04G003750 [Cocos nucifera]|uniref:Uncharacterized protein n=1 Tax=Cocos nucifera TaxID=13894 RepID=A0A8K0I5X4_COCNU|nr:hypothetical protein COCNU_04G003750 [Cocos nucifera]